MKPYLMLLSNLDEEYLADLLRRLRESRFPDPDQINALERILDNAEVLPPALIPPGVIQIDCAVRAVDIRTGRKKRYTIVLPECADMAKRLLSVTSPLGIALLGHRQGEVVEVNVPGGVRLLRIERVRQIERSLLFEQQRSFHVTRS